jgi:predicted nucleic acid-binding protein
MVSNTSPLIAFSAIGRLDVLQGAFGRILIPQAVATEIVAQGVGWSAAKPIQEAIRAAVWIEIHHVAASPLLTLLRARLDAGESEAIVLAHAGSLPVLLNDEDARREARGLGLEVTGALGVLKLAKLRQIIPLAKLLVVAMLEEGIYYGDRLIEAFLRDVHE